ncbi:MAG TPA: hypothetical protein VMH33_10000 [Solirubrobacterales bacterium]|nr:hypothetical protein [Solirubrobacterales bacterium]
MALVAALGGTAFAAAKLNSTQKKEVEKIAKKYAGKNGAAGPAGPAGPAGGNGKDGVNGINGTDGSNGIGVTNTVEPSGANCANGGSKFVAASTTYACNGTNGANGSNATFEYLFNSATSGDPTSKNLLLNNATPGSATALNISETNNEGGSGTNIANTIKGWISGPGSLGTLMVRKVSAQSTYAEYSIVKNEDKGSYDELTVKFQAGNGSFANGDPVTVQYFASGSATLPSGSTETGAWTVGIGVAPIEGITTPISFLAPLAAPPTVVYLEKGHTEPTACPGNVSAPAAAPGKLCVYTSEEENMPGNFLALGTFKTGAALYFLVEEGGSAYGTWAVTAP